MLVDGRPGRVGFNFEHDLSRKHTKFYDLLVAEKTFK